MQANPARRQPPQSAKPRFTATVPVCFSMSFLPRYTDRLEAETVCPSKLRLYLTSILPRTRQNEHYNKVFIVTNDEPRASLLLVFITSQADAATHKWPRCGCAKAEEMHTLGVSRETIREDSERCRSCGPLEDAISFARSRLSTTLIRAPGQQENAKMPDTYNPFAVAQRQLDDAAAVLRLDEAAHQMLRWPLRELRVTLPVRMDDGSTRVFRGFRVQHSDARGPTNGGLRFHPDETINTVRALAAWMTWKTALVGIPLGGSNGGVICNPKELSLAELERLSRAYVRQVGRMLGPDKDVPAPDVYTTPQVMAWMADEFSFMQGQNQFGVTTGKPLPLGGSAGRSDATARGGVYTVREAASVLGIGLVGSTAAIQGYGNAGSFAHQLAVELLGVRVVAVSDSRGGIYAEGGLDYADVMRHKRGSGSVIFFPGAQPLTNEQLLELDVDILFPSALECAITTANAGGVKAKIIAELANGPTSPDADAILHKNGAFVIPDLLCNAGGVTVSYFEMVQNAYGYYWPLEMVHDRLDRAMTAAFRAVHQAAQDQKVSNRMAAYLVAVARVAEAMHLRGWV